MKSLAKSFTEVADSFSMTDFGMMSLLLMNFMFNELRHHLMNSTRAASTVLMTPCYFGSHFAHFLPGQWMDS